MDIYRKWYASPNNNSLEEGLSNNKTSLDVGVFTIVIGNQSRFPKKSIQNVE